MTKPRDIEDHLEAIRDIAGILGAMKNFALMETQKLGHFSSTQHRVVEGIEMAAADFLTFYPAGTQRLGRGQPVCLLIGSERGLCGDFNEILFDRYTQLSRDLPEHQHDFILVGSKLAEKLEHDHRIVASLPGPTVTEEIQPALIRLMDSIREVQIRRNSHLPLDLTIIHHRAGTDEIMVEARQPFHPVRRQSTRYPYPPTLTLDPFVFVAELFDHYLLSILHEVFFSSLMAENLKRFQHMDQAIHRLQRSIEELTLTRNRLRQEEITEEIEVIMLSAAALEERPLTGPIQ
jgi:F-type H+-transporting ATPase subunit gamma